jgi:hypothetical protein
MAHANPSSKALAGHAGATCKNGNPLQPFSAGNFSTISECCFTTRSHAFRYHGSGCYRVPQATWFRAPAGGSLRAQLAVSPKVYFVWRGDTPRPGTVPHMPSKVRMSGQDGPENPSAGTGPSVPESVAFLSYSAEAFALLIVSRRNYHTSLVENGLSYRRVHSFGARSICAYWGGSRPRHAG